MTELLIAAFGCFLLGLMSTLHPCPLATNMAAISTIVSATGKKRSFTMGLLFFGMGYMISLICVAILINLSIFSIAKISLALQNVISLFLGPVLILVGMLTSGLLRFDRQYTSLIKYRNDAKGAYLYNFSIGMLLALAFCPATAALYFGILIPLSLKFNQAYLFPFLYAFGGVLPIVSIGFLIRRGGDNFRGGKWAKSITLVSGYLLIIIGIFISVQRLYLQ